MANRVVVDILMLWGAYRFTRCFGEWILQLWFLCCFAEFWHQLMVCYFLQLVLLDAYGDVLQFYKYDLKYITWFNHWFFKFSTSIFKTNRETSWWSLGSGGKTRYWQINISNNITLPKYHVDQMDIHVQHGYNFINKFNKISYWLFVVHYDID